MSQLEIIPFYILNEYLDLKDLINLSHVNKYLRQQVYNKTRELHVTIKYFSDALVLTKIFKKLKLIPAGDSFLSLLCQNLKLNNPPHLNI